ncbi:hypothetical protein [Actinoallomurus iriomotensis]|uniref:Secreted protein n=1 Tax=Actinoallomurus iriomotensis TaxID=478107 RepID=A0A9W6SBP6_9ACTN|nr:hypothetical protein [Actinoallomurus iriomotensis]GLY89612.1 hypothetical protein Airi02_075410 [Actinoallomurus iriomotensis]
MRKRLSALAAAGSAIVVLASGSAATAATENYGDYSRMFSRSAGQYWSGGQVGGQWAWSPQNSSTSDISWGDPAQWPPAYAERFVRRGDWVELEGYSGGQGKPVTQVQRVTSEKIGDAGCGNMTDLPSDGGRQHYVRWTIPSAGYCLDASGTITSPAAGTVVHFRHRQRWTAPASCSNAYFAGRTCLSQHEQWWDDNGHAYSLRIDRTQYIARGLGMAFAIRQTVPSTWAAASRYYWSW